MNSSEIPAVDFDHWGPEYAADPDSHNLRYSAKCPVAFNERHGGFWFVTGHDEVACVARDDATFSSHHDLPTGSTEYLGIGHPPMAFRATPIEIDPPAHAKWRTALAPDFSPAAVRKLKDKIVAYTTWCIDQKIESGHIDLVADVAATLAAMINLDLMGVPSERAAEFAYLSHAISYTNPESDEFRPIFKTYSDAVASLAAIVEERRKDPREDFISTLAHMQIDGQRVSDGEIMEVLDLVVSAGIDTTASGTACALKYLNDDHEARQRLIDDPALIQQAVEEFLRVFSPVQVLARTATKDVEVGGQQIRQGERVLVSWAAANMDERTFPEPERVILDRFPNRHVAFGLGIHRCLGSHLARAEMTVLITEILRRMPDYQLTDGVEKYGSIRVIQGYVKLPATFTPGPRLGPNDILSDRS
jgi:cytochrome P450